MLALFETGMVCAQSTGSFIATGSMTTVRIRRTATLLFNGRVLITGGYGSLAELYDTITGTFTATGDTTVGR